MFVFSREINIDFSEAPEKYETQSPQILNSKFELLAFHESLFSNLGATVTTLVAFPSISTEYYMFVGYDNGSIGIYFLGHLNLENTFMNLKNLPFLLLVYQAHYPELNLPFKPLCLQLSPWATGFGSTYLLEYFSIGSDFKVVHWGLRRTYKYDVEHSVDIDTLGVHKFPFGSVESSRYQHLRKENPLSLITPCICPFTIKSLAPVHKFSRHCSSRGLIVSVCGMLAIFLVQQPSRLFTTFQCPYPFISASTGKVSIPRISIAKDTRDDPECGVLGDEVSESDTTSEHLLFCLSEGNILAYSITTGELVFQMAVPVHVPSAPVLHSLHFMDGKLSSSKECSPCHLHFSANTSHLMIGYTDGTCCLCEFELSGLSSQSTIGQITQTIYLPENVHKSPITFMKTIEISSQIECKDSWLLVGDSVGFISIWMIPHQRDQRYSYCISILT